MAIATWGPLPILTNEISPFVQCMHEKLIMADLRQSSCCRKIEQSRPNELLYFYKRKFQQAALAPWTRIRDWRFILRFVVDYVQTRSAKLRNSHFLELRIRNTHSLCSSRSFPNVTSPFQKWSETHETEVLSLFPADWFRLTPWRRRHDHFM